MSIERPTFHEAWYRVANLHPRLLSSVQVSRQHFRGRMWYVLENPSSNKFSRLSPEAYRFIAMLDGRRTIAEVWRICNEQLGDMAPTQGEVIQLLGQLYCANLLYSDLAPDTAGLFNRYSSRIKRQIQGFFTNLLFIKIPLIDPDRFLERWTGVFGRIFSPFGMVLWLAAICTGLYFVVGNFRELIYQSSNVLAPGNLILLYLTMVVVKVCHEFAHAFACKKFGAAAGAGGQVHVMGVMFLVFVPLPYVDASTAWGFREKRRRVVVGMAGIMAELFAASVAAVVWANTSTGTAHIIAYNVIFIASISTLVFNGNPLLRFDAYYVLSDLLEIPNLGQRSKDYLYFLVKKHLWKVKAAQNPAHTAGEKVWFVLYGPASVAYRVFICIRILLFLNSRLPEELFILVPLFAFSAIIAWVCVPLVKFVRYLAAGQELARTRGRAVGSVVGGLTVIIILTGLFRMPDYCRVQGIVEPSELAIVHNEIDGFVADVLPSGSSVTVADEVLVRSVNPRLRAEKQALLAERRVLDAKWRIATTEEVAAAQIFAEQIEALDEKIARTENELASLSLRSSSSGMWVSPEIDRARGAYLQRGTQVGFVADLDDVLIRATAGQSLAAMVVEQARERLEIRVKGRPHAKLNGRIEKIFPAGHEILPSQALGYAVGGAMPTVSQDPRGIRTAEKFFEIRIRPDRDPAVRLLTGQRVVVRIQLRSKPLLMQLWISLRQLFQRRFRI
ncbi:MAG: efflux RND transporter periplasmic adaptor subunit [Sedimentisphaerales bacterium]|nr:efflux RND transporter periplasmic adaptor subunit [Sedimentisphaerales bacterium]